MHNTPPGAAPCPMWHPAQCGTQPNVAPCSMRHPAQCSTPPGAANKRKEGQLESQDSLVAPLEVVACLKQIVYLKFKIEPRHRIASYHLILGVCNIIQFQRCAEQITGYAKLLA